MDLIRSRWPGNGDRALSLTPIAPVNSGNRQVSAQANPSTSIQSQPIIATVMAARYSIREARDRIARLPCDAMR